MYFFPTRFWFVKYEVDITLSGVVDKIDIETIQIVLHSAISRPRHHLRTANISINCNVILFQWVLEIALIHGILQIGICFRPPHKSNAVEHRWSILCQLMGEKLVGLRDTRVPHPTRCSGIGGFSVKYLNVPHFIYLADYLKVFTTFGSVMKFLRPAAFESVDWGPSQLLDIGAIRWWMDEDFINTIFTGACDRCSGPKGFMHSSRFFLRVCNIFLCVHIPDCISFLWGDCSMTSPVSCIACRWLVNELHAVIPIAFMWLKVYFNYAYLLKHMKY